MGQRGDLSHRGSAAWPTLRPCPGLRALGGEFSGAPDPGCLADDGDDAREECSDIFQSFEITECIQGTFCRRPNASHQDAKYPSARVV
jgi:hypothetical protein